MSPLAALALAVAGLVALTLLLVAQRLGLIYRVWHRADSRSPRHGGELVAEVLRAHGVRFLFTLPGGHISPVLVACEKLGIRVVDTRHEATAVHAADAVSRLTGRIGVAAVTAGPGVTNAVTAVKNAQMAESPLLLLAGAAATLQKGRGALQDIPQVPLFRTLCKATLSVRAVRQIVPTLRRAIATAQEGTPGPVLVELPLDVLYPFHVVQREIGASKTPKGLRGKLVQWYLGNYVQDLFAGAWEPRDPTPLPLKIPMAPQEQVQECAELLSRSQRPLVLVGSQALLPPTPAEELRSSLQSLGVPCFLGGAARGLLPPTSPLLLRHNRRQALRDADLVLLAGTVCDFRLSYGRLFGRGAAVVAVNRDRGQLLKNSDAFWTPRLAVKGDPASFVVALSRRLPGFRCPQEWLQRLRKEDRDRDRHIRAKSSVSPGRHLNPLALLRCLERLLPPNALLVADGGDFVATAAYVVRARRPRAWLDPGPFGTLGVGGGFALGAKLSRPESEVWVLYGDGSVGFSIVEFDTFVRHKVPVLALVGNDAGWTQISREQLPLLGSAVGCTLRHTDYHAVVAALGGRGFLLDSPGDIGDNIGDIGDIEKNLRDNEKNLGDNVGDTKNDLGDTKKDLGDIKNDIGDTKSGLGDTKSGLGDTKKDLGDTKGGIGDIKNGLGDIKKDLGDTKKDLGDTKGGLEDIGEDVGDIGDNLGDIGDIGDLGDIGDRVVAVLRAARAECHRGHPVLVNAILGPSDFREGSVSV